MSTNEITNYLNLAHWRRTTAEMYTAIRQAKDPNLAWDHFVATRNQLFKYHPQSPLSTYQRESFTHLAYYPYDPSFRVIGHLSASAKAADQDYAIDLGEDGLFRLTRVAMIHAELFGQAIQLSLFWVQGYGGGLFLPFKDQTNRTETFGGGRYLYDTIKGADLGVGSHELILDFNFAYNPSCAYNVHWVCPLSPQENDLNIPILAGEKTPGQ